MINYFTLFLMAFTAATLIPAQSEAVLFALFVLGEQSVLLLILVASVGNVLGSTVNWWLGVKIETFKDRKWFPVSRKRLEQAQGYYRRYGSLLLLLSWLPVIGDPITLVAGVLRENIGRFLLIVSFAKVCRYIAVYLAFLGLI